MTSLFQEGTFTLHSGATSAFKIECDALTDTDITTLAALIAERADPFGAVEGVPRGGFRLAEALRPHISRGNSRLLIVDDVYTTGASLRAHLGDRSTTWGIRAWVIFSRCPIENMPIWAHALFQMDAR